MVNQVISVNKKKYAVGLFWQPVSNVQNSRAYARTLARGVDKKLNLFAEYHTMVALGSTRYGHRSSMPSAAAAVVSALPEYTSFLAAFDGGDFFYVVAVRNGIILHDRAYDTMDAARREYFSLAEIPDWGGFIAPAQWGAPRAVERGLAGLLSGVSHVNLRWISRTRGRLLSLLFVVLFIMAFVAIFRDPIMQVIYPRPKINNINPELAAEYKRRIAEKNRELDAQFNIAKKGPDVAAPLVMPYEKLPDMTARAEMCYRAMGLLMQPVAGWNQTTLSCGEKYATAEFRRDFGSLGDFYEIATGLMPGAYVQEQGPDTLMVRVALPTLPEFSSIDERDADTVMRDVRTAFQSINTDVSTDIVVDTISNGTQSANVNVIEVSASSKMVPVQFMQIFGNFGGVYMTGCTWGVKNRTWNYEVIIYAK